VQMRLHHQQRKPQEELLESESRVGASYLLASQFVLTCEDAFAFLALQTCMVNWR
jgi:hypothetical protein